MKYFILSFLSIFIFSCQQKENKNVIVESSDTIQKEKFKDENKQISETPEEENKQIGDTIFMNSKNKKDLFIAEGSLDSLHPRIYVKFKIEDLGKLKGNIVPTTGKGNIRFNQIIFPDKSSDGPFGMDLTIPLKQKGNYVLVIGHSQMADNPYYGKFKVELENKGN
ncbi:hypothetical protein BD847_2505 [Flavobacterium cutihirudinis]|uniref:Lipoprotein n=1 Tax=Flavobacterium cutihirudinis TaxID=1265740 RepID=A0A3D9FS51_9FLAO|nr:hypothetical protein [Flavobacterium cutihirudinis]RED23452.1 hypothetical protein BD847_2505 [Flavobacterium cutihirudinis]